MAKDPAFIFYSADFLTGVQFLSHEQRGKYITLLCMQHQQGHLKEKHMLMVCGVYDADVFEKFKQDEDGLYYNLRLETEQKKRAHYNESRRQNRAKKDGPGKERKKTAKKKTAAASKKITTGDKQAKPQEPAKPVVEYPFESANFKKLWAHWKDYKSREHGFEYASAQSEQAALKKLAKLSNGNERTAMEIIAESMANGWKGFFELNENKNNAGGNNHKHERNPGIKQTIYDIIGDTSRCF